MHVLNQIRLGQHDRFSAVLEGHRVTSQCATVVVRLHKFFGEQKRPHRAVEQQNALGEEFFE